MSGEYVGLMFYMISLKKSHAVDDNEKNLRKRPINNVS